MRRIQVHLDEHLDEASKAEATRRGVTRAALIRSCLAKEVSAGSGEDPWTALTGWLDDEPVDDIDEVVYGDTR